MRAEDVTAAFVVSFQTRDILLQKTQLGHKQRVSEISATEVKQ